MILSGTDEIVAAARFRCRRLNLGVRMTRSIVRPLMGADAKWKRSFANLEAASTDDARNKCAARTVRNNYGNGYPRRKLNTPDGRR